MTDLTIYHHVIVPYEVVGPVQDLYESSFPAAERAPFDSIKAGIEQGSAVLFCSLVKEEVVGFATLNPLSRGGIYFLGYIAVNPAHRGLGIGSKLIGAIHKRLERNRASGILLEVDSPDEAKSSAEHDTRVRRIRFYEKNGGVVVPDGGIYRMPDLTGPGSLGMRLIWIPVNPLVQSAVPLPLSELFTLIYSEMYGLGGNDPLVIDVLSQVI